TVIRPWVKCPGPRPLTQSDTAEAHAGADQSCLRSSQQLTCWHNRVVGLVTQCWIEGRMQRGCVHRVKLEVILHGIRGVCITRRNDATVCTTRLLHWYGIPAFSVIHVAIPKD